MQHYFEARREDPISYGTSSAMDFTGEVLVLSIGSDRRDCPNLAPDVIRYLYLIFIRIKNSKRQREANPQWLQSLGIW